MKKNKLFIVLIILILLLSLAGGVYAYLVTDLFKTPQQLFSKYLLNNAIQLIQFNYKPFDEIFERSENEPIQYSVDYTFQDEDMPKYNINMISNIDLPNNNESTELIVKEDENTIIKGKIAVTDQTFGLQIDGVHEDFLALENRDLKKIAETFELDQEVVDMIPDKIPEVKPFTEEENEKIKLLYEKYSTKILEQITEDRYSAEKNIDISIPDLNGTKIKVNKYTLTINSKDLYLITTNAITELLEDPEFLALCKDRITDENLEKLKTQYEESLKENENTISDNEIKISVYASKGKTVRTEIDVEGDIVAIMLDNQKAESTIYLYSNTLKNDVTKVGRTCLYTLKNKFENNSGEIYLESKVEYNKKDIETLTKEQEAKKKKQKEFYDDELMVYDENFADDDYVEYNYSEMYEDKMEKTIIKTTKTDNKITAKFELDSENKDNEIEELEVNFKFGPEVEVKKITKENSKVLNDYTTNDFLKLFVEISMNLITYAEENPDALIVRFIPKEDNNDNSYIESNYDDEYSDNYDEEYSDLDYTHEYTESERTSEYEEDNSNNEAITDSENYINLESNTADNNLSNVTVSIDEKNNIKQEITYSLKKCILDYKMEAVENPEASLDNFLTVDNVQKNCPDSYNLELLDGTTIKCTIDQEKIYYVIMEISGDTLDVANIDVFTEEEYENIQ